MINTQTRINKVAVVVFSLLMACIGAYYLTNSFAAVSSTYYVSASGSDSNNCGQATPCQTLDKAYRVASAGDVVLVSSGTYPQQNMTGAPKASGTPIIIQPAPGSTVNMGTLVVEGPSYVTFKDFKFTGRNTSVRVTNSETTLGSNNVVFENLSNIGKIYAEGYVKDITFRNIEAGDVTDNQSQIKKYDQSYPTEASPTNILIENTSFHDYRVSSSSVHSECLQIINSVDVTVRNSKLYNCSGTAALGVTNGPHIRLTVENNWLAIGTGQAFYSAQITKNNTDFKFRYNSSPNAVIFSDTDAGGPYLITGNYMGYNSSLCGAGITTDYNVFSGGACGTHDTTVSSLKFVNPTNNDYHLLSTSEAKDRGNPNNFPVDDIDGEPRPSGPAPDAGADEATSSTPPPTCTSTKAADINCDTKVNITDLSIFLSNYGKTTAQLASSTPSYPRADINSSGKVEIGDLSALLTGYGK